MGADTGGATALWGIAALSLLVGYLLGRRLASTPSEYRHTASPLEAVIRLTEAERAALPYPPDVLPGGRQVRTPYGSIRVFEWGNEAGEKVLLLPGLGAPVLSLGDLAEGLVARGFRVMMFDYFGRGYSDNPDDVAHDTRLFVSQIFLALASSQLPWTGRDAFHLIGYSLGGGVAVCFAGLYPHMIRSLVLVAPAGLYRRTHLDWKSRLLYSRGVLPQWLLSRVVRWRIKPAPPPRPRDDLADAQRGDEAQRHHNPDATGGATYDHAVLSRRRPGITVATALSWQIQHHAGFLPAFMSSYRDAPIFERQDIWTVLARHLARRRASAKVRESEGGLAAGKILLVLGEADAILVEEEILADAYAVLGKGGMEVQVMQGAGHEVVITKGDEIAKAVVAFWGS